MEGRRRDPRTPDKARQRSQGGKVMKIKGKPRFLKVSERKNNENHRKTWVFRGLRKEK